MDKNKEKIWNEYNTLVEIFPALKKFSNSYDSIVNASCSSCKANSLTNQFLSMLAQEQSKANKEIPKKTLTALGNTYNNILRKIQKKRDSGVTPLDNDDGARESCLDCCRKHIAQAIILFQESELPEYSSHFWLAIGHLAEAESESLSRYYKFSQLIRETRLLMMEDRGYKPNLVSLIEQISNFE